MKKGLSLLLFLGFLLLVQGSAALAENTKITTLGQAVRAAWAISIQPVDAAPEDPASLPGIDVAQANGVALDLALLVIDLDLARQKITYLQAEQQQLQKQLVQAEKEIKMGKTKAETGEALKKALAQNGFDLNYYRMQEENGQKIFAKMTGAAIADGFQYESAYLITDAGKLSLPAWAQQRPDAGELTKKMSAVLLVYGELGAAVSAYIEAGEKLIAAQRDFKMGKVDQEGLETAAAVKEAVRIDALESKAGYAKILYELDCSLQGYISRDIKQVDDPIFLTGEGNP